MGTLRPRTLVARVILACLATAGLAIATPTPAHAADRDCGDFASQRAAQLFFLNAGGPGSDPHGLDSDGDGIACESNPAPYYYGTTPPSAPQPPAPPAAPTPVASRVSLTTNRTAAIAGEAVVLRASVTPRIARRVQFQRWTGSRWIRLVVRSTTQRGAVAYRVRAPKTATRYRATVAPTVVGRKRYTAATSAARALRIQRQAVTLTLSRSRVAEFGRVTGVLRAAPVRTGRPVGLQERGHDGRWRTVRTKRLPRSGRIAFAVDAGAAGVQRFRVWVAGFGGAAGLASAARRLTAVDQTPPDRPTGLVATSGDESVDLSWDLNTDDAVEYRVYQRASGSSPWLLVETTTGPTSQVVQLVNDTSYDFSVVAVDRAGNASPRSTTASAVPTVAAPPSP